MLYVLTHLRKMNRSYEELKNLESWSERLEYLKLLDGNAKSPRGISMGFYKSHKWKFIREQVITRDLGFDLGANGIYITGKMFIHHINPIDESDILNQTKKLTDLNNLILCSQETHNLIHYGNPVEEYVERQPGDTKLW